MKLSQLRNLVAVVEVGSVRQAAKNLHLSQSSITKSIQQLEQRLGTDLLRRSSHGVAATEAGKALLAHAKRIEAELRHAWNDVEAVRDAALGEIRVSASPTVAMGFLPRAIVEFQRKRPRVSFLVQEGVFPDVMAALRTGELDLAVCLVPEHSGDDSLHFESLVRDRLVPAVRAEHPVISMRKVTLRDLRDFKWVIYRRGRSGLDIFEQTFISNNLEPPKSTIECTSFAAALALVENGDYITLVPTQIFSEQRRLGAIEPVLLDAPMPPWQVAAISRPKHELSAVCLAFLGELHRLASRIQTGSPRPAINAIKAGQGGGLPGR
jgi:DNA-binding transcriptional LysR family regulator